MPANYFIKSATMTNIANAIREKTGGSDTMLPSEMSEKILSIQGGTLTPKDVNFYTPYGELVFAYTVAEAQALTALPQAPVLDRLIFQEWNHTLETIKDYHRPVDVGGTYTTASGKTELDMVFDAATGALVKLRIVYYGGDPLSIDWGDGSAVQNYTVPGNITATHNYYSSAPGKFTISIGGGHHSLGAGSGVNMFNSNAADRISHACVGARLGSGTQEILEYAFSGCFNLASITIPLTTSPYVFGYTYSQCAALKAVVLPNNPDYDGYYSIYEAAFSGCLNLSMISLPVGWEYGYSVGFGDQTFVGCQSLRNIVIPRGVSHLAGAFNYSNISSIVFPRDVEIIEYVFVSATALLECFMLSTIPPDIYNFLGLTNGLLKIKVPQGSLMDYRTETNWVVLASHIVEMTDEEMYKYGLR